MTSLEIIKDELERINEARAKATQGEWDDQPASQQWKDNKANNAAFCRLAANEITRLTKALSVAVETLQTMNHLEVQFKAQGGVYNPKLGCVKHETIWDVTTKPSEGALTTIANILSGGKDGK